MSDPKFKVGDTVKVYQKIEEEGKTRTQMFQGLVIAIKNREENKSFTVRKIGAGAIGVERIWPVNSPSIEKITVFKHSKVRRAKLYFIRKLVGKKARQLEKKGVLVPVEKEPEVKPQTEEAVTESKIA